MAGLIVADASAVIAYLDVHDEHHRAAVEVLVGVDEFVLHPLTLTEVLVHPARADVEGAVMNTLFSIGMRVSQMSDDPVELARLRVRTGLKLPDCVVLATAIRGGMGVLTFDDRLRRVSDELGC